MGTGEGVPSCSDDGKSVPPGACGTYGPSHGEEAGRIDERPLARHERSVMGTTGPSAGRVRGSAGQRIGAGEGGAKGVEGVQLVGAGRELDVERVLAGPH